MKTKTSAAALCLLLAACSNIQVIGEKDASQIPYLSVNFNYPYRQAIMKVLDILIIVITNQTNILVGGQVIPHFLIGIIFISTTLKRG